LFAKQAAAAELWSPFWYPFIFESFDFAVLPQAEAALGLREVVTNQLLRETLEGRLGLEPNARPALSTGASSTKIRVTSWRPGLGSTIIGH